jgi:hypothetical protein
VVSLLEAFPPKFCRHCLFICFYIPQFVIGIFSMSDCVNNVYLVGLAHTVLSTLTDWKSDVCCHSMTFHIKLWSVIMLSSALGLVCFEC